MHFYQSHLIHFTPTKNAAKSSGQKNQILSAEEPNLIAIRTKSSGPKIWLHFCPHLTLMIISNIRKPVFTTLSAHLQPKIPMHNYASNE